MKLYPHHKVSLALAFVAFGAILVLTSGLSNDGDKPSVMKNQAASLICTIGEDVTFKSERYNWVRWNDASRAYLFYTKTGLAPTSVYTPNQGELCTVVSTVLDK